MEADGVDFGDEREVSAWIEGFNARSFSERKAATSTRAPAAKRAKRKATRRARRRSRH
jgi:hypothetical protein